MDAENPKVSGTDESQELPTPQFSNDVTSSTSTDADAIVSKLTPILEQLVEKKVQSTKDKRISKIEKALGGRLDLLAELEGEGVEIPKDLRMQMQIRDLEERLTQPKEQPAQPRDVGTSSGQTAVADAIAALKENELDANDPAFIELLRGTYTSREAFDLKVQRFINGKLKPQKQANPADVVQSPARSGASDKSEEALRQDYIKEMKAARGKPGDIRAIREKYQKEGVNIYDVDFS